MAMVFCLRIRISVVPGDLLYVLLASECVGNL